jgi:gas vesicle protein
MGQDPDVIRREIEQTRERMGETVEALGYKADVPSRAKDKVTGVKDRIVGTVDEHTPSAGDVKHTARRGASVAQENPLGLAIGSVAIGFLAGMLIPSTRVENEKLGPVADQVKETAQEAVQHGRQVAQEVASTAQEHAQQAVGEVRDTAQQAAQEHGQQVKENAQQAREEVRS